MTPPALVEAVARAVLSANPDRLRICAGPAPCMPGPCSCTQNLYPLAQAAIATVLAHQWQPIATAPKDGRALLGHFPQCAGICETVFFDPEEKRWWGAAGPNARMGLRWGPPTHWMPLPAPPSPAD